ncbi:RNA polymerase sigma factor [Algoriphagus sp. Y33]|uniref:RNA polymerase sigma factor n=1 Tax=Algoriphagus sp. Y33 TaxID=2772483 RepID=UPI00177FB46A|nr:sigma-70 family RNA polymerase sigma factor [Algoriphagus sp. Y33]
MENLSDSELYALIQQRNYVAFDRLFDRYWDKLFKYAYNILADKQQCEDVIQEVFTSVWENAPTRKIQFIPTYLYNSVKYQTANVIRTKKWHLEFEWTEEVESHDPEEASYDMKGTRLIQLEKSLAELPPKCREVMELRGKKGLTAGEIAENLGISTRTVEGHMQKGMKLLKASLTQVFLFF